MSAYAVSFPAICQTQGYAQRWNYSGFGFHPIHLHETHVRLLSQPKCLAAAENGVTSNFWQVRSLLLTRFICSVEYLDEVHMLRTTCTCFISLFATCRRLTGLILSWCHRVHRRQAWWVDWRHANLSETSSPRLSWHGMLTHLPMRRCPQSWPQPRFRGCHRNMAPQMQPSCSVSHVTT